MPSSQPVGQAMNHSKCSTLAKLTDRHHYASTWGIPACHPNLVDDIRSAASSNKLQIEVTFLGRWAGMLAETQVFLSTSQLLGVFDAKSYLETCPRWYSSSWIQSLVLTWMHIIQPWPEWMFHPSLPRGILQCSSDTPTWLLEAFTQYLSTWWHASRTRYTWNEMHLIFSSWIIYPSLDVRQWKNAWRLQRSLLFDDGVDRPQLCGPSTAQCSSVFLGTLLLVLCIIFCSHSISCLGFCRNGHHCTFFCDWIPFIIISLVCQLLQ